MAAGNYTIKVTDLVGCTSQAQINIPRNPPMLIDFVEKQNSYCGLANGMIVASVAAGNPSYTYTWDTPIPQYTTTASQILAGNYTLTVTDIKGCTQAKSTNIQDIPAAIPLFDISSPPNPQFIYLSEAEVHFQNLSQGGKTYSWDFGDNHFSNLLHPWHTYTDTGTYNIVLTAYNGSPFCPKYYSQTIHILPDGEIYIPNVFSPNQDGENEVFKVGGWGIKDFEITIYDRWGKIIGVWNNPNFEWNGTKNNENLPEGVYTFYIKAKFFNNPSFARSGTITLIR